MNFEFKKTIWERITISEELETKALELIKSGEITTGNELFDWAECQNGKTASFENMDDSETYLGEIEVTNDEGIVWENS